MSDGVGTESFETTAHSGLAVEAVDAPHCTPAEGCITCGDVAVPLEVVALDLQRGLALCRDETGRTETVEIALVPPVEPGDQLLVHAGTAIARITAEGEASEGVARGDAAPPAPGIPGREAEEVPEI
jgi:hydrogenase maturation factor